MLSLKERVVRVESLGAIYASHTYAFSDTPEEYSEKEVMKWQNTMGLLDETTGIRFFGRNICLTKKPKPHSYELYLTIPDEIKREGTLR